MHYSRQLTYDSECLSKRCLVNKFLRPKSTPVGFHMGIFSCLINLYSTFITEMTYRFSVRYASIISNYECGQACEGEGKEIRVRAREHAKDTVFTFSWQASRDARVFDKSSTSQRVHCSIKTGKHSDRNKLLNNSVGLFNIIILYYNPKHVTASIKASLFLERVKIVWHLNNTVR